MRAVRLVAAALLAFSIAAHAAQPGFPARPVRLIVANAPGAAPDTVARLIGAKLTEQWGQSVVIDNRPGATGLIAAETVARAAPDGYTLWLNTMTQLISTLMYARYPLATDFAPVMFVATTPFVFVVNAGLPVKSIADWIAYAKARPGQLRFGSAGQWGSSHLCMESFNALTGLKLTHVPYKSSPQVLNDLLGGEVHIYCTAAPSLPTLLAGGRVKPLAITYKRPTPLVPGVPPIADTVPGFELLGWYALQAPLRIPKPLVEKINADFAKVLTDPDVREKLFAVGAEAAPSNPEALVKFLREETARWQEIMRASGERQDVSSKKAPQ